MSVVDTSSLLYLKNLYIENVRENQTEPSLLSYLTLQALDSTSTEFDMGLYSQKILSADIWDLNEKWWEDLSKLRQLTNLTLLIKYTKLSELSEKTLHARLSNLFNNIDPIFWINSSQLHQFLMILNLVELGLSYPNLNPHVTLSGFPFVEHTAYIGATHLSSVDKAAEMGIVWMILSLRNEFFYLKEYALQLTHSLTQFLDNEGVPFSSLFSKEDQFSLPFTLQALSSLFIAATTLDPSAAELYCFLSYRQLAYLQKLQSEKRVIKYDPYLTILAEQFIYPESIKNVFQRQLDNCAAQLPSIICDRNLGIMGYRSSDWNLINTCCGENGSCGSVRLYDVEISAYGPQLLPLGKMTHFGIYQPLSRYLSCRELNPIEIFNEKHFHTKARTQIAIATNLPSSEEGIYSNLEEPLPIWLDLTHQFQNDQLQIEVSYVGLQELDHLCFVFYIQAKKASIEGYRTLIPRSLDRYQGSLHPIIFEGEKGAMRLELHTSAKATEMRLIPLAGENSFWEADYLVAYMLASYPDTYRWTISKNKEPADQLDSDNNSIMDPAEIL